MNRPPSPKSARKALLGALQGPPFGVRFFTTVIPDRVKSMCDGPGRGVPVLLLQLADGTTLDLCHIQQLTPQWMLAAVFRETRACEEMDAVFIPYETIIRVTVSLADADERRIGFQLQASKPVREGHRPIR